MSTRVMLVVRCPKCKTRARLTDVAAEKLSEGIDEPIVCAECGTAFLTSTTGDVSPVETSVSVSAAPLRAEPPFKDLVNPDRDGADLPPFGSLEAVEPSRGKNGPNAVTRWWLGTSQRRRKQLVGLGMVIVAACAWLFPVSSEVTSKPRLAEPTQDQRPGQAVPEAVKPPPHVRKLESVLIALQGISKNQLMTQDSSDELLERLWVEKVPDNALTSESEILNLYALQPISPGQILRKELFGQRIVREPVKIPIREVRIRNGERWKIEYWVEVIPGREILAVNEQDAERMAREAARAIEAARDSK